MVHTTEQSPVIVFIMADEYFITAGASFLCGGLFKFLQRWHERNVRDISQATDQKPGNRPKQSYSHACVILQSEHPRVYKDPNGIPFELMAINQVQEELVEKKTTETGTDGHTRDYTKTEARVTANQGQHYFPPIVADVSGFMSMRQVLDESFFPHLPFTLIYSSLESPQSQSVNVNVNVNNNDKKTNTIAKTPIGTKTTINGIKNKTSFTIIGDFCLEDGEVVMRPAPSRYSCITTRHYGQILHDELVSANAAGWVANVMFISAGILGLCGVGMRQNENRH